MERDEIEFEIVDKKNVSIADIQDAVTEAWGEMRERGTSAYQAAVDAGIDVSSLPGDVGDAVEIRPAGAGLIGVDVIVVGLLSKMAYDVWKGVWDQILLPKLKRRFGETVLAPVQDTKPKDPMK